MPFSIVFFTKKKLVEEQDLESETAKGKCLHKPFRKDAPTLFFLTLPPPPPPCGVVFVGVKRALSSFLYICKPCFFLDKLCRGRGVNIYSLQFIYTYTVQASGEHIQYCGILTYRTVGIQT